MKTSLSHIPENQQDELDTVVEILKNSSSRDMPIEMIILYGSYARGDFVVKDLVAEGHTMREYKSDFDIMLVTRKPTLERNLRITTEISRKILLDKRIQTPVSLNVEHINNINEKLEEGHYFYLDLKKEGIMLHDTKKCNLSEPQVLSEKKSKNLKQEDYDLWYGKAQKLFEGFELFFEKKYFDEAAFLLHQVTEDLLAAYLLVQIRYKPKTHDLKLLFEKVIELDQKFSKIFDLHKSEQDELFELLRKAYVDARYSKNYSITELQLEELAKKIQDLNALVKEICEEALK